MMMAGSSRAPWGATKLQSENSHPRTGGRGTYDAEQESVEGHGPKRAEHRDSGGEGHRATVRLFVVMADAARGFTATTE